MQNNFYPDTFYHREDLRDGEAARKPTLGQVSMLYSLAVVFLVYIGFRIQRYSLYPGLLITEFILILMPSLLLLYIKKYDFKKVLRLNRVSVVNLLIIFCIMLFVLPVVGVFNLANLWVIKSIFGKIILPGVPISRNSAELLINILIIGGSAGICEEVMFRGVIQRGLERLGAVKSILITAFLFGMLHLDFQRLLGTFLLGALIGFIVYRTNSIFAGMFAHFTNNSLAVILSYISGKITNFAQSAGMEKVNEDASKLFSSFASMPTEQLVAAIIAWTFIFMFCAIMVGGLILALIRTTAEKAEKVRKEKGIASKSGLLWLIPGILLVTLMYISIGFRLTGYTGKAVDIIMRIMGVK